MQIKQIRKSTLLLPSFNAEKLSINDLETIVNLGKRYGVKNIKITGSQRIALLGLDNDTIKALQNELGISDDQKPQKNKIQSIQACPGRTWCEHGRADTLHLLRKIETIELKAPLPAKVKIGISGCRRCCSQSWIRDIGLIAENKGWKFTFGGNGAGNPRIGDIVTEGLSEDEVAQLLVKTLTFYSKNARPKIRTARFIEKFGIKELRKNILLNNQYP